MVQESANSAFGKFVWYDQMSLDLAGSGAFYEKVVGWTLKANEMNDQPYTVLTAGDAMVGGLILGQALTLYTTPVIYLYLSRLQQRLAPNRAGRMPTLADKMGAATAD